MMSSTEETLPLKMTSTVQAGTSGRTYQDLVDGTIILSILMAMEGSNVVITAVWCCTIQYCFLFFYINLTLHCSRRQCLNLILKSLSTTR